MTSHDETKLAVIALLRSIGLQVNVPISLYEIGPPLVAQRFTESDILHALYAVQDDGIIDLIEGNRLVLVKPV